MHRHPSYFYSPDDHHYYTVACDRDNCRRYSHEDNDVDKYPGAGKTKKRRAGGRHT